MGKWLEQTSRRTHILLRKMVWESCIRTGYLVHKRIISAVKTVEFVSDRMS
jgi:hypothetical protein